MQAPPPCRDDGLPSVIASSPALRPFASPPFTTTKPAALSDMIPTINPASHALEEINLIFPILAEVVGPPEHVGGLG
jgi:hypothetical protein